MGWPPVLIINPNTNASITALMLAAAERIAPQMRFRGATAAFGSDALRTQADLAAASRAVEAVMRREGECAGIVIGAFGDPGIDAARALAGCPVVGLGESGLRAAAATGRFGVLTLGTELEPVIAGRVARMGLSHLLTGIRFLNADIPEVAARPEAYLELIAREAREAARAGASAMLLGGAPFSGLGERVRAPIPVIDGLGAAIARLRDTMAPMARRDGLRP